MKRLAIIGAAELGMLVQHFAEQSGNYQIAGYYDDHSSENIFNGKPILGKTTDIQNDFGQIQFFKTNL